ncbi:MAG TPA: (d)CMP kinase, partial [Longimicrobiales bacterium]|nr:(d)CMP kinase [Longimicrobiales bacterium]
MTERSPTSRSPLVTVDGPAGSGKSTTAREVARRLGFRHLDSGALYRAVTYALLEAGVPEQRWADLTLEELQRIPIGLEAGEDGFVPLLGGEPIPDDRLRTGRVTSRVSQLASVPAVRRRLLELQREAGAQGGVVADGRDMGTVVFPGAEVKVFLTADPEERARRRLAQE